jgi:hypothetical protein
MLFGELIMTEKFGFNEALKAIQSDQAISGRDAKQHHSRYLSRVAGFLFGTNVCIS